MAVYAVPGAVPAWSEWFTAGKLYEVLEEDEFGFLACSDMGLKFFGSWKGSSPLSGGNWTRIERDEP